ncbi:sulfate permease [Propionibacterium acidifaciens]|uniref:sulfate permease n=1 Tax=Propionibacterium acidifaciens TaxID=556499 RepID=UPI0028E5088C|nr:sulfate permease [Propionibacterium acidifaciens]
MFRLLWIASIHIRAFMRRYMPSNIILDLVRTRRGLKWGPVAMLLAAPYGAIAYWLAAWIEAGGPEWLYLLVLVCLWSALKMIWIGPLSLVALLAVRIEEARNRHLGGSTAS